MKIRALDIDGDFSFGKGRENYLTNQKAIAQNIQTRLLSFLNDCFFDMNAGMDWPRLLGTKNTKQEIELSCRSIILASYGVARINKLSASFDSRARKQIISYNIDTIFSSQFSQNLEVTNVV